MMQFPAATGLRFQHPYCCGQPRVILRSFTVFSTLGPSPLFKASMAGGVLPILTLTDPSYLTSPTFLSCVRALCDCWVLPQ